MSAAGLAHLIGSLVRRFAQVAALPLHHLAD